MKANIYTGAVQFINIYIYHDVKTKTFCFLYVGAMQGHSIIHGNGMNINTVARHINNKVDNKLVFGLTDR